jgi:hypothetical protein
MWISSLNMDGGVGKKMQEGGSGMGHRSCKKVVGWEKNARRWPSPEVITGSDWSSVSGTTSANSSTPHSTETRTKYKQASTETSPSHLTVRVHQGGPGGRLRRHLA